jgi:hypothetical protein
MLESTGIGIAIFNYEGDGLDHIFRQKGTP